MHSFISSFSLLAILHFSLDSHARSITSEIMARPPSLVSPPASGAAVQQQQQTKDTRRTSTGGLWRPRSIGNLLNSLSRSPASVPLPLLPVLQSSGPGGLGLHHSPTVPDSLFLPTEPTTAIVSSSTSTPLSDASGIPNNPQSSPPPSSIAVAHQRYSLALLDGAIEELGVLSPELPVTEGLGRFGDRDEQEDEGHEAAENTREGKTRSLAFYQLPSHDNVEAAEDGGQQRQDFGQNMLWDALGLEPEFADDSSLPYSRSDSGHSHTSHRDGGSIASIPSIHAAPIPSISTTKAREHSSTTTDEGERSSFDISNFPSYSDLTTFATSSEQEHGHEQKRSSNLLSFPVPPLVGARSSSEAGRERIEEPEQSDMSREEQAVFERLDALGGTSPSPSSSPSGLGLFDGSSTPSTPGLLGLGLDFPSFPTTTRTSEDSASASNSGHSTSTTLSTFSSHALSSANTSFTPSDEHSTATYHQAAALPHRLSALPFLATAPPREQPPVSLSTTPPLRAVASLPSLPEIFRTHPSPEGSAVVPLVPAPRERQSSMPAVTARGLASPLTLDTTFVSRSRSSSRSASPVDYGFGPYPQQQHYPQPQCHQSPVQQPSYYSSPPFPSLGVFVASMQPRDSFIPSPSPASPGAPFMSNDSPYPSFGSPASSRAGSPTGSPARMAARPAIRYMASTDSLGLEGDNGMPLWSTAAEEQQQGVASSSLPKEEVTPSMSPKERPALVKSASAAPRSPLATAAPVVAFPSSPPLAAPQTQQQQRPLSGMTKRLSFMNLRKRKSEANLGVGGGKQPPSPLVLPATTTGPAKLARRSVSSPRLSSAAKEKAPPLPLLSPALGVEGSLKLSTNSGTSSSGKENMPTLTPPTRSKTKRFSAFMFGPRSPSSSSTPKLPPSAIVVPPVPSLPLNTPMSAPPTTMTFSLAQLLPPTSASSTSPSFASSSSARDDTPSLSSLDNSSRDDDREGDTTADTSILPATPAPTSRSGYFDYALLGPRAELQYSPGGLAELGGIRAWSDSGLEEQERSGSSTPILAGLERCGAAGAKEQEKEELVDLKGFIKTMAPVEQQETTSTTTGDKKALRPVRSSSFFSGTKNVFPSRSSTPVPLGDSTNLVKLEDGKRALSPLLPFDTKPSMERIVVPDVVAFPLRVDSRIATSQEEEDAESSDSGDEAEVEEPRRDSSDSDDKPLGVIPGALKMQKSLRQDSRKARTSSRQPSPKVDPFEFDKTLDIKGTPSTSASTSTAPIAPPLVPVSVGHSLLPQTDEAVERRSSPLTRSPSSPLDPLVAESALTIDSPVVTQRPLAPVRSATLPSSATQSRDPSPRRPSLGVHTSVSATNSSSLAPPRPTGRLPPTPSGPPSRRPSQQQERDTIQRQRSNTALSSSAATAARPTEMQRGLSARSNGSSQGRDTSPSTSPRIPSPALPTVEHRIFVGDHSKRITFAVSAVTTAAEVVASAKSKGALTEGTDLEGGWALWEICRTLGVERPIREYELVADIVKTWDQDSNILIIRRTTLWPLLSSHLRPQPTIPRSAFVQLEMKKGKWSKRYLELKDGVVSHAKSEKLKDSTTLCQLSSFEFFFVGSHVVDSLKAPKPFVFALKSKLPRAHYENQEDYCYFLSVKTQTELTDWAKALIEARNAIARQQGASWTSLNSSPSLSSRPHLSASSHTPTPSPPLSRTPTLRPAPAVLAVPSRSRSNTLEAGALKSPPVAMGKPDARAWAAMSEVERQSWLKEAQRDAREKGKTLLDFGGERR